ncbi:L domain-like protein [Martensiomyces pterosporus]|nr:L domain-like protein [Martensiomyces pterosporus]
MELTATELARLIEKPLAEVATVDLKSSEIAHVGDISDCIQLRKLVLSNNKIKSKGSLRGIRNVKSLTYLDVSGNGLDDIDVVENLPRLSVLNLSSNKIKHIPRSIAGCSDLKALILGHNSIKQIENIDRLANLNTLVVSHNKIEEIPRLAALQELTKLSAAHNRITTVPDLAVYLKLKEVRLNDNKIESLPESIRSCSSLKVLDLGSNLLSDWESVAPLASLTALDNLNLKGNPICEEDEYRKQVLKMVPSLRILDGVRFDQKFLKRKYRMRVKKRMQVSQDGAAEVAEAAEAEGEEKKGRRHEGREDRRAKRHRNANSDSKGGGDGERRPKRDREDMRPRKELNRQRFPKPRRSE